MSHLGIFRTSSGTLEPIPKCTLPCWLPSTLQQSPCSQTSSQGRSQRQACSVLLLGGASTFWVDRALSDGKCGKGNTFLPSSLHLEPHTLAAAFRPGFYVQAPLGSDLRIFRPLWGWSGIVRRRCVQRCAGFLLCDCFWLDHLFFFVSESLVIRVCCVESGEPVNLQYTFNIIILILVSNIIIAPRSEQVCVSQDRPQCPFLLNLWWDS